MKKIRILMPVDFSDASRIAARYGLMMLENIPADVVLLHMVEPYPLRMPGRGEALGQDERVAYDDLEKFKESISAYSTRDLSLTTKVAIGEQLHKVVSKVAAEEQTDLIVMGTEGASWLRKYLIGTHAGSVVRFSPCPVLTVPAKVRMQKAQHIVYATDMLDIERELNDLIAFARLFNAWIHVLHVFSTEKDLEKFNSSEWLARVKNNYGYKQITFCGSVDDEVVDGIEKCLKREHADMLAVFSHRKNYVERLLEDSVSLEEALRAELPLLTLYKEP